VYAKLSNKDKLFELRERSRTHRKILGSMETPRFPVELGGMKFICQLSENQGTWTGEYAGPDIGPVRVTAPTRPEAVQKLEGEIRYWLEMCPCTGETYRDIEVEVVESAAEETP